GLPACEELARAAARFGGLHCIGRGPGPGPGEAAFREEEFAAHLIQVVLGEPFRAVDATDLLVCRREETQRSAESDARPLDSEHTDEIEDAKALHVQRAAAPDVTVA